MTTNERYVEMKKYTNGGGDYITYRDEGYWWGFSYGESLEPNDAYAIIESDIRKQLVAAGWSLTWVADNPGDKTYYAIDKITVDGVKHYMEFADYAATLLYAIQMERELYGAAEG